MLSRWPDAPILSTPAIFATLEPGNWLAEEKLDGWRTIVHRTPRGFTFTTRHNKVCPLSRELSAQLEQALSHLPVGSMLDSEWLCRRAGLGNEKLVFFDMLSLGSQWQGGNGALARFELLKTLVPSELIVGHTLTDYAAFFERTKLDPLTEGVVLKRCDSRYIGSTRGSVDNPGWVKVRYRAGAAGDRKVA